MRRGRRTVSDLEPQVEAILEQYPETRDSDTNLWLIYCEKHRKGITKLPTSELLLRREEYGIPSLESIGRCRRKIQERNPYLKGSEYVTDMRYEMWKEYRDYALSN